MFFKNLYFFAFTRPFELHAAQLEESLAENKFTPCASTELQHFGFIKPFGKHGDSLVHHADGSYLICARKEEKILPAPVIKDMLDEKIEAFEVEQGRGPSRKEREQFKEDIIFELLPRAFSRITDTHAYINAKENIIAINTSSRGKAEDALALLRKSLGTLPVTTPSPEVAVNETMTEWLTENKLSEKFAIGMEAELSALGDDAAVARFKHQDLLSEEVKQHLDADKCVNKIALEFDESISFVLHDDLSIKRIKFYDVIAEQNEDIDSDDALARLDADFILMASELNRMISNLLNEFNIKTTDYLEE